MSSLRIIRKIENVQHAKWDGNEKFRGVGHSLIYKLSKVSMDGQLMDTKSYPNIF